MTPLDAFALSSSALLDHVPSPPREHHTVQSRDLEGIVDAIDALTGDEAEWSRKVATVAARVFRGRRASLEILDRHVAGHFESPNDFRIVAHHDTGASVVLSVSREQPLRLGPYQRLLVARIALHLENAVRMRRCPHRVRARVSPDGELIGEEKTREANERAFGLWRDLIDGRATLAMSNESAPSYLLIDAPVEWYERRALTPIERQVVMLAARGMTGKALAYALDISTPSVSRALRSAASKIGLRTIYELVRIAARLATDEPPRIGDVVLTDAEREVLDLVRAGLSNRAIAQMRGRSPRTVANQVASLLRKTRSASRRTLAAARASGSARLGDDSR